MGEMLLLRTSTSMRAIIGRVALLVSLFCGGCTFDGNGYPNSVDHGPPPPDLPPDAAPLIPDIPSLWPEAGTPDSSAACASSCVLGCNSQAQPPRCWHLGPSTYTLVETDLSAATADLVIDQAGSTINTDTGEIQNGSQVVRPPVVGPAAGVVFLLRKQNSGPELGGFIVSSLRIKAMGQLQVVGSRALAVYVATSATIDGLLRAPAAGTTPGSGGFAGGAKNGGAGSCPPEGGGAGGLRSSQWTATESDGGGGGGGRLAPGGGGGGWWWPFVIGVPGGKAVGDPTNKPLFGGCGGGGGGGPDKHGQGDGGYGGGGGGAIQLSVDGLLSIGGTISVPGAGGQGGVGGAGGGGGGSGGAILLEAVTIELRAGALLAANGGGGGAGAANRNDNSPAAGEDGHDSQERAAGGENDGDSSGRGGQGGAKGAAHGDRGADQLNGGGGGGAAGVIRLVATVPPTSQVGATSSPGLSAAPLKELW